MSENTNSEALADCEKPVQVPGNSQFPPFPAPTDDDFEEDIPKNERTYYTTKFKDLNNITNMKIHCTACDRHLGLTPKSGHRMRTHPMLRTLVCQTCHSFYNSGEFEKGDDGSELYCRWCGQGGQVYCCSSCPHVFCAKCIKRNLGPTKIKEIEELDDWKCFKCNNVCLKDLRAICWAALRYCDVKNRIAHDVKYSEQKELLAQDLAKDHSVCCRAKFRRKEKLDMKRKESERKSASASSVITKIPPTIQVKKFASINLDEANKPEPKKAQKRTASPKNKPFILKNPISVATKSINTFNVSPMTKKMRVCMPPAPVMNPIRIMHDRKQILTPNNYIKIRPKTQFPMLYNGLNAGNSYNNMINNDNINLSLDSLTQGLDMAAMSNIARGSQDNELVCTPDFPIEPLCEVTEDNTDDDVQCITPVPNVAPKVPSVASKAPPPLVPCGVNVSDISSDNIIQMTENDVTVNTATGGLKFRVDPQTLSANKMYRLPDGRIFAINANPNMPGGYSATIVAVTETNTPKNSSGATYAAKINHVTNRHNSTPTSRTSTQINNRNLSSAKIYQRPTKATKRSVDTPTRETDLLVPVEWYRYNLIDAIDALEYSLSRLHKLKKEATTSYLRTRSVQEMRTLHKSLENLLNTSTQRFKEIRETINKELKQYVARKNSTTHDNSEDDDDVEILPDMEDDPIFIDENSLDSTTNETQEVDLTGAGSSEHNDSGDKNLKDRLNESMESIDSNMIVGDTSCKESDKSFDVSKDTTENIQKESDEPNSKGEEPNTEGEEPNTGAEESNTEAEEPNTGAEEPNTEGEEPYTEGEEPDIGKAEPDTNGQGQVEATENDGLPCDDSMSEDKVPFDEENIELTKKSDDDDASKDKIIEVSNVIEKNESKNILTEDQQDSGNDIKVNNDTYTETSSKDDVVADNKMEITTQKENGDHIDEDEKIESKNQDIDISDEMIDDLLKGDSQDNSETQDLCPSEISDEIKDQ